MNFQNTISFSRKNSLTKVVRNNINYTSNLIGSNNNKGVGKLSKTGSFPHFYSSAKSFAFGKLSVNEPSRNNYLEISILFARARSVFAQARILFGSILRLVSGTRQYFSSQLQTFRQGEKYCHQGEKCSRLGETPKTLNLFRILLRRQGFSPGRQVFSPIREVSTLRRNTNSAL